MFEVGDKVMYPMQGAGIISEVEQYEVLGEMKDYYILQMPIGNIKIMLPVAAINDLGIRCIISSEEVPHVIKSFSERTVTENTNWSKRYRENIDKLKSGCIYETVDVYKALARRDREKGLSSGEKKIFNNARQIIFSELILACELEITEIEIMVEEALICYIDDINLKVGG